MIHFTEWKFGEVTIPLTQDALIIIKRIRHLCNSKHTPVEQLSMPVKNYLVFNGISSFESKLEVIRKSWERWVCSHCTPVTEASHLLSIPAEVCSPLRWCKKISLGRPSFAGVNFELCDLSTTQMKKLFFGAPEWTCGAWFLFKFLDQA